MALGNQIGPAVPTETHKIQDRVITGFVSRFVKMPGYTAKEGQEVDERCSFGDGAFDELVAKMGPIPY
jgi:hypothetical protein